MAKTSSTVHLEDSTWEEIRMYQEKYSCTRNEAIERMFVERRLLLKLTLNQGSNIKKTSNVSNIGEEAITSSVETDVSPVDEILDSAYEDMPE